MTGSPRCIAAGEGLAEIPAPPKHAHPGQVVFSNLRPFHAAPEFDLVTSLILLGAAHVLS